jgi:predicted DNA-binding protein
MTTERLEVRLGAEHRRKLDALAKARGRPVSAVIREAIDWAYEEDLRERRLAAARRIAAAALEDVPDPETLKRQLDEAHEPGGLS